MGKLMVLLVLDGYVVIMKVIFRFVVYGRMDFLWYVNGIKKLGCF